MYLWKASASKSSVFFFENPTWPGKPIAIVFFNLDVRIARESSDFPHQVLE